MKKILLLVTFIMFSISVSAHQPTTPFTGQIVTKTLTMESSFMNASGNGGILQLIYNIFYKVGSVIATTLNDEETPQGEETSTEN